MKIILSRKGFDNQYGGQPSPILPDGTLLSLPIPKKGESINFEDLSWGNKNYHQIIKSLNPKSPLKPKSTCHLDPDLSNKTLKRDNSWQPLFGQADSALGHLIKSNVGEKDLFLFFGTFRETEYFRRRLRYKPDTPEVHLIYGYFQVEKLYREANTLKEQFPHHPHSQETYLKKGMNGIFTATKSLSFNDSIFGAGLLKFDRRLILTKTGFTKSRWDLPNFFNETEISYHSKNSFKTDYFQSAAKGQEFIIKEHPKVTQWAKELIIRHAF